VPVAVFVALVALVVVGAVSVMVPGQTVATFVVVVAAAAAAAAVVVVLSHPHTRGSTHGHVKNCPHSWVSAE